MEDRAMMRAVVITRPGGPEVLELRDVPRPEPGYGQVLVHVRASALNRADLLQREGRYPAPPDASAQIPGIEFAGDIAALGDGVRSWKVGERVFGIIGGGAHAEYVVAHERAVARVPDNLSWSEAAAIPEVFITAHDALVAQASLRLSESVLIHAVGSGVGLAAVQLTRSLGGVPFGTARTAEKIDRAREYGLEDGLAVGRELTGLAERVDSWTGGRGVDVVLDLVGGPYVTASVNALAAKGRLILIGTMAGRQTQLPLGRVLSSRLTIRGTVLRARPLEERILATRAFAAEVVPLLARGALKAVVDSEFALADIQRAHAQLESNATVGKVVVRVST
jgi:NADPH:quinone reductase